MDVLFFQGSSMEGSIHLLGAKRESQRILKMRDYDLIVILESGCLSLHKGRISLYWIQLNSTHYTKKEVTKVRGFEAV
jgi:hypothetical protein